MTSRPELGSVAPPARIPPKSWTATQMRAKATMASRPLLPGPPAAVAYTPAATMTHTMASSTAIAVP